ncbi:hypothetical protein M0638_01260 [Roseomonas sp. NAR14]|uniref:Uncharacterized protein n=1 Tax=Roseomonas acroporae TaxID=2937791 RepID=A0A9X1Y4D5_9PROT|nr:hypothetical protein [Roseomonas acroporae]MCK8783008.1 hypothetical protein [Roseomonas acroporae]
MSGGRRAGRPAPDRPARRRRPAPFLALAASCCLAASPAAAAKPEPPTPALPLKGPPPAAAPAPGQTQAQAPLGGGSRFRLYNDSTQPIDALHLSTDMARGWSENLLGQLRLPPGAVVAVTPAERDHCTFDLRLVYADRRVEVRRRADVCQPPHELHLDGSGAEPAAPGGRR